MTHVIWDLNGTLVHNNKSLGTGDLPEGYGSDDPFAAVKAFRDGELPRAYYLTSEGDIEWIDGALEAIRLLNNGHPQKINWDINEKKIADKLRLKEAKLIAKKEDKGDYEKEPINQYIITNQEQIGLTIITKNQWLELQTLMDTQIRNEGGRIMKWFYCPHKPSANCNCRKRTINPGLVPFYLCAGIFYFNLYDAYMIGDNISDMVSGKLAGCKTIMVETPVKYDPKLISQYTDYIVDNALAAAMKVCELENVHKVAS